VKQYASGGAGPVPGGDPARGPDPARAGNFLKIIVDAWEIGRRREFIPVGVYQFVTIFNNTRFDFNLFRGESVAIWDSLGFCPSYSLLTFPFDSSVQSLMIEWSGITGVPAGNTQRCMIFLTEKNLGVEGQFRLPQSERGVIVPDRILYSGILSANNTTLFAASQKIIVRAAYFANTDELFDARITLVQVINAISRTILHRVNIPLSSTLSLGHLVFETNNVFILTEITGQVTCLIYGEGV